MVQRTVAARNMDEAFAALDATADATYSVAWIDCVARGPAFGRSLVFAAEHATRDDLVDLNAAVEPFQPPGPSRLAVPIELPAWALNRASVAAFNEAYFRAGAARAGKPFLVHWKPYFFPLDGIGAWNRIYGRGGFLQHQCVIPAPHARRVLGEVVERLSRRGNASFLAVLKQLGPSRGMLSFPVPGYTLALDVHVDDHIFPALDEIDRLVVEAGGRLYLAKDARQSRETFEATYPELGRLREIRRAVGAEGRITSRLSVRLGI
jgi:FAD/FMN-containing dehydrogenase